jgi:hypothetical protein
VGQKVLALKHSYAKSVSELKSCSVKGFAKVYDTIVMVKRTDTKKKAETMVFFLSENIAKHNASMTMAKKIGKDMSEIIVFLYAA